MIAAPGTVYEDDDILVANKPAGLLTHPRNAEDRRPSLLKWFLRRHPKSIHVGDPARPGIVHRLDRETSGLIILAKTQTGYEHLKRLFHERLIAKIYIALVYGHPNEARGEINIPLYKLGPKQSLRQSKKKDLDMRQATTHYRILRTFRDYALVEAKPFTGRMHQIRLHLKALGTPVVCDPLYRARSQICPPELGRMFLHASALKFTAPSGRALTLESDPPSDLSDFLAKLA